VVDTAHLEWLEDVKVDASRPVPFHAQVYETLERLITTSLHPGDQLPGEPKLCEVFGVSRTVIRHALEQLDRDGLIVRIKGKGTFVAEPKINEGLVGRLTGFYEDMVEQGYLPVSQVLCQEPIKADSKIAHHLGLQVGEDVIAIKRLRYVNDVPLQLVTTYLPYALCQASLNVDFTHQSLYEFLRRECDLHIAESKRMIEAVLATDEEAELLKIERGAPLILLDSVSYLEDGTPLEYYRAVHRSDRARFEVKLMRVQM
jgi:GntR family transcriptional regulator